MRAFKNYFLFIIIALGTILAVSDDDLELFKQQMLVFHNIERYFHNAGGLILDNEMSIKAKEIAEHWIETNENLQITDGDYDYNIYSVPLVGSAQPLELNAHTVFLYWYLLPIPYNYNEEPQSTAFDAFTRIVWKGTIKLGIAKLKKGSKSVVVATYSPAGNKKGQYINNVEDKI